MSSEARVQALDDKQTHRDQILAGMEGTMALVLKEEMLELELRFHERLERMNDHHNQRFDKLEILLTSLLSKTI